MGTEIVFNTLYKTSAPVDNAFVKRISNIKTNVNSLEETHIDFSTENDTNTNLKSSKSSVNILDFEISKKEEKINTPEMEKLKTEVSKLKSFKDLMSSLKNQTLSSEDIKKVIYYTQMKLDTNKDKINLHSEIDELESLYTKVKTIELNLVKTNENLTNKTQELKKQLILLKKESPELANMISKILDMIENSKTESSKRLRLIFLCKVQEIISDNFSPEIKISRLEKAEKNFTNLIKHIHEVATNNKLDKDDARNEIINLIKNYSGNSHAFRKINTEIDFSASVVLSAVRRSIEKVKEFNEEVISTSNEVNFKSSLKNDTNVVKTNFASFSEIENNPDVEDDVEDLLETSLLKDDVKESINIVIEHAKREPDNFHNSCLSWKENKSFENYLDANIRVFKEGNKLKLISNFFNRRIIEMKLKIEESNIENKEEDYLDKFLEEEANNLIEQADILEMEIIDNFRPDPENHISELLKKFRDIIEDLDTNTRASISKQELKVKIDKEFLRKVKEAQDHLERLDFERRELKRNFEIITSKKLKSLA